MSSLHRRVSTYITPDPGDRSATSLSVLGLHYSTARPFEVRLRLPMAHVAPGYSGLGTYAAWSFDRQYLKASTCVIGPTFGIGDVRAELSIEHRAWVAELRRGPFRIVVATRLAWMQRFALDVERMCPDPEASVDIDACIAGLLGVQP